MAIIKKYPLGSDITIMNASYHKSVKDELTQKWNKDYINIVYKDNKTGKKDHQIIYEPDYIYYKLKDGVHITDYTQFYVPKNAVRPITCKYRELLKSIAEETNNLDFFFDNIRNGNYRNNKSLHKCTNIFGSDMDIEDHYRMRFAQEYTNEASPLQLGYMDIETDIKVINNRFPDPGEVPANAVTYIDDRTNSCNVFLLRDIRHDNPLIPQFEQMYFSDNEKQKAFFKELQEFIIYAVGGIDNAKKFKVDNLKFNFYFFNNDIELIFNLFREINYNSPDFLLAWNMAFDIPYLIERCRVLGFDPAEIISDENYEKKYANYFIDKRHKNSYEARGDYYDIASNVTFIDQLIQFASRRKGQSAFPNFKLDTAADVITKGAVRKLNYSNIVSNLGDLPYVDYKTFVFYNIVDVVSQKCIEESVNDIGYVFKTALSSDTRYSKAHRQTVYLGSNMTRKMFYEYEHGGILGNNANIDYTRAFGDEEEKTDDDKFAGAMVGDPEHNSNYAKLNQDGQVLNVADNCDDFDAKSMYPSIDREYNLAPDNIIGKVIIDQKVHKYENPYHDDKYDRGGQFMEDLITENSLEFGKRWLSLGGVHDLIEDIKEYQDTHSCFMPLDLNKVNDRKLIKPIQILDKGEKIKPVLFLGNEKEIVDSALASL